MPHLIWEHVIKLQATTKMLGCKRDEHFLSAGFLRSSIQSSALDQILHPTPKAAQLTSPAAHLSPALRHSRTSCVHHIRFIRPFLLRCFRYTFGLVRKINGENDQQSTICNVCHVGEDEDESIPCCPTLGSLTSEHKRIHASGRR